MWHGPARWLHLVPASLVTPEAETCSTRIVFNAGKDVEDGSTPVLRRLSHLEFSLAPVGGHGIRFAARESVRSSNSGAQIFTGEID